MEKYPFLEITIPNDRLSIYAALKDKHNPEGSKVRNYQHHLTDTLVEFDKFCQEHGVEYSLAYGTMLGAIRHKGFIPWDDDADILMTRDNYDKLLSLTYSEWHSLNDKIGLAMGIRPTIWMAPFAYIDIFVLDASPENIIARKIKQWLAELCYCLVKCRGRIDGGSIKGFKPWYVFLPMAILAPKNKWDKLWRKVSMWKNDDNRCKKVQAFNNILSYISQRFEKTDLEGYVYVDYEGHRLPVFKGYDNMLKVSYGDYMSLPKNLHIHGFVDNIPVNGTQNDTKA